MSIINHTNLIANFFVLPYFSLSISTSPREGRIPLTVVITGVSSSQVNTWNWFINGIQQIETTQQINRTFTQKGQYLLQLVATDIYSQGPLTVYNSVVATSNLAVLDSALDDMDPNRVVELAGSADFLYDGKGIGVKTPIYSTSFNNAGFSHASGPDIIFS